MSQNILVAGCQDKTQNVICQLLRRGGMHVQSAATVSQALDAFVERPSLVIVDLAMDEGNGLEVIRAIRAGRRNAKVAVISSGSDTPSGWLTLYRPDAIFGKPFDFADFVDWLSGFDAPLSQSPLRIPIHNQFQAMSNAA